MKTFHTSLFICLLLFSISTKAQNRYDIVIHEIMADPTPQIGLPNSEWIELRNTTTAAINLSGWRMGDASGLSGAMPSFVLQPDSCVVVCTASAVAGLLPFGSTISVTSFPSLDNAGKLIYLRAPNGRTIHAVQYSDAWYGNVVKADGGWTLEMIDAKNPCSGVTNWKASVDAKGGTPGKKNSVNTTNTDATAPKLLRAFATDALNCTLYFDEPLDSLKAATVANYSISDGIGTPASAVAVAPLYNQVTLRLSTSLQAGKVYTITATNITDCSNNTINANNTCRVGLAALADTMDVVVNELLFNPNTGGVDYVEFYNRSSKNINLKNLLLSNRSSTTGAIGTLYNISADNYLLFPGEYIVATENAAIVKSQYQALQPNAFLELGSMPSYPNDKGAVVLLDNAGKQIDELDYNEKWHFALIDNPKGIALERIDPTRPTNDATNWSSAASTVGYGTPTYQNSQFKKQQAIAGNIDVKPELFSPDNDGFDDFAFIRFKFPEPGYVANITIYDAAGRAIKLLQRNATCAAEGSFRWDGLNDKLQKVPVGIYVVYTEIFNLKGQKSSFKNTVALARKF
jgi:hypothetical protein